MTDQRFHRFEAQNSNLDETLEEQHHSADPHIGIAVASAVAVVVSAVAPAAVFVVDSAADLSADFDFEAVVG